MPIDYYEPEELTEEDIAQCEADIDADIEKDEQDKS